MGEGSVFNIKCTIGEYILILQTNKATENEIKCKYWFVCFIYFFSFSSKVKEGLLFTVIPIKIKLFAPFPENFYAPKTDPRQENSKILLCTKCYMVINQNHQRIFQT